MKTRPYLTIATILALTIPVIGCGDENADEVVTTTRSALFSGSPFYDSGTVCTVGGATMHCCPEQTVMIGVRVDQNIFKCQHWSRNVFQADLLDTGTVRNGMHACPVGSLMRGLHVAQNLLICDFPPNAIVPADEFVDVNSSDGVMHVCGQNGTGFQFAMAGIRVDQNLLTCDTDTKPN